MSAPETVVRLLSHCDWANEQLILAANPLSAEPLDRPFDMGMGSLRRTLLHIFVGECVWLQRWMGRDETKWHDETEKVSPADVGTRLHKNAAEREAFLKSVGPADLERVVQYRDSKGRLFKAPLHDMMIQMILHSAHHRAQAVNMLRRVGANAPELDYMYHVRIPAE